MPIKQRHGNWTVDIHLGGKRYRRSLGPTGTRQQARALERHLIQQHQAKLTGNPLPETAARAWERWLMEYVAHLKSKRDIQIRTKFMLPYIDGRTVLELRAIADDVQAALSGKGRNVATINRHLADIRRVGRLCAEWGWLDHPPTIRLLPGEQARHVYLSPEQVAQLANACTDHRAHRAVWLLALTGMRRGELMRLTEAHIVDDAILLDTNTKSGKPRLIPLPPEAMPYLRPLPLGIAKNDLTEQWLAARKACDLEHVQLRDLRHTYASWLVAGRASLYEVQHLLGHSTPATTQRYAHLQDGPLREAVKRLRVK